MITWQAGIMLHPGAQAKAEHRKTSPRAPEAPMHAAMAATRQSGHQLGAQSRHHPGASFPLARRHCTNSITNHKNNLTPVSIFRGEDQDGPSTWRIGLLPEVVGNSSDLTSDDAWGDTEQTAVLSPFRRWLVLGRVGF